MLNFGSEANTPYFKVALPSTFVKSTCGEVIQLSGVKGPRLFIYEAEVITGLPTGLPVASVDCTADHL